VPRRTGRGALLAVLFTLVALLDAFWLVAFFSAVFFDPSEIDGFADVIVFLVGQVILTGIGVPLFRGLLRGRARARARPPGRSTRRAFQRSIRRRPTGRHTLAGNPIGPRTGLSANQISYASWLPGVTRLDQEGMGLPEDSGLLDGLALAEQALGNALYELDVRHALSREKIVALRTAALEASARLTTEADWIAHRPSGTRKTIKRIHGAVSLYTDLATEAENFLGGRIDAAQLDAAREALVSSTAGLAP
jgi:hypothetical protein